MLPQWDEPARLYVESEEALAGTLREVVTTWSDLPEGQDKENAHVTMTFVKVAMPEASDGRKFGTLYADHMRTLVTIL